jgi:hypothetical protein
VSASRVRRHAADPFPVTATLITEGIKRLRTIAGAQEDAHSSRVLWRGARNMQLTDDFREHGGSEVRCYLLYSALTRLPIEPPTIDGHVRPVVCAHS